MNLPMLQLTVQVFKWFDAHQLTSQEVQDFDYLSDILENFQENVQQLDDDLTIKLINDYQIYFTEKVASYN